MDGMPSTFEPARDARDRFVAGGRFILFAAVFYGLLRLFSLASNRLDTPGVVWGALVGNLTVACAALAATAILAKLDRAPFGNFGLQPPIASRFGTGALCGLLLLSGLLLVLRFSTSFRYGSLRFEGAATLGNALLYAALFIAVAFSEETLWRGYALVNLTRAVSFWPAAILLSLIFGASHLKHDTESMLGVGFAALFGVVLAWSFLRTGSLWLALGIHAGWDYAQSFVYGVPDSGVVLPASLLRGQMGVPTLLTGGKVGPEGSILMILVLGALALFLSKYWTKSVQPSHPGTSRVL